MNTFYLVRHAHAAWTPDEDRPLSAQGQSDTIRVADLLEKQRIDTLSSSPCRRAHQTIEPLAARLSGGDMHRYNHGQTSHPWEGTSFVSGDNRTLRNFILFIILFFAAWGARATVLYPIDETLKSISPVWREVYAFGVRLLLWIAPVFIYLIAIDKVDPFRYLRLTTPVDWKELPLAIALIAAFIVLTIAGQYALAGTEKRVVVEQQSWTWYALLLGLPAAPISEEILFRGFLLRKCQDFTGFWRANLITSLLFVAIHWPYWLYSQGLALQQLTLSVPIFVVGMFAGYLAHKTNSLWPSILMHLLNNFISVTFVIR